MIQFVFTVDYEIYGNGAGSLRDLVYDPMERLMSIFQRRSAAFVTFAEAIELRKIEEFEADEASADVRDQLRRMYEEGFEIALHLHPWWSNAVYENGSWQLDYRDLNICRYPKQRIEATVSSAIGYLRDAVGSPTFSPASFRGGLWLMQPTRHMAEVLARAGVQIDSSVFKGGRIRGLGIDYRDTLENGYSWRFSDEVASPDPDGFLTEIPIYSEMVPFWKMLGKKRLRIQKKVPSAKSGGPLGSRWGDFVRLRYPRKLDFCRMSYEEMRGVMERVIRDDKEAPGMNKVIVAIGHSKDLIDFEAIEQFLGYLEEQQIEVTTFQEIAPKFQTTSPSLSRN